MPAPASPMTIAQSAWQALLHGLQTKQWQPLRDHLTDEVTIWFPREPFLGLNRGKEQTIALLQSIPWEREMTIALEQITCNGTTVMLELRCGRPGGTLPGFERAAIALQVSGDKICALQPYLLLVHPTQP